MSDPIPVHQWLLAWKDIIGLDKLQPSVQIIKRKLGNALKQNWHPSDKSAKPMVSVWKPPICSKIEWVRFVQTSIVPALERSLINDFRLDPSGDGKTDERVIGWVIEWRDLVDDQTIVRLLSQYFFPSFLEVLRSWLGRANQPNNDRKMVFKEIVVWYSSWKKQFPVQFIQNEAIKKQFLQALNLMKEAME
ncbi:hypothetical protein ACOME3_005202 [Neoechinorhynchus agilis]